MKFFNRKNSKDNLIHGNRRGEVISVDDPLEKGRCKIRVFGVYDDLSDEALPWAIYADPFMGGNTDLGGFWVPDVGSHVWVFFEEGNTDQPVYFSGAPARPDFPAEHNLPPSTYPRNKIFKTKAGHILELDDSPEATRIRVKHQSGTHKTIVHDGSVVEEIVANLSIFVEQNANIHVKGNATETIEGDCVRQVQGNLTEIVMGDVVQSYAGDHNASVAGRKKTVSGGGMEIHTTGNSNITGSRIDLNSGGGAAIELVDGDFVYSAPYAYSFGAAYQLVRAAGTNAPFDTPEEESLKSEAMAAGEYPEEEEPEGTEEVVNPDDVETPQIIEGCPVLSEDVYNTPLGNGTFTVRDLTLGAIFPHPIVAQKGLTVEEIVCNLHHLCVNVIDPLKTTFPELNINSCFRRGNGTSFHYRGLAVDCQATGRNSTYYKDVLDWIADNIPYSQTIIETSGRRNSDGSYAWWIHVAFDPTKTVQDKQRLTYIAGRGYTSGWNLI